MEGKEAYNAVRWALEVGFCITLFNPHNEGTNYDRPRPIGRLSPHCMHTPPRRPPAFVRGSAPHELGC